MTQIEIENYIGLFAFVLQNDLRMPIIELCQSLTEALDVVTMINIF